MNGPVSDHVSNAALLAYLDGTLTEPEGNAVRTHLSSCGRCSRTLASLRTVDTLARSLPAERTSSDLVRAIMLRVGISPRQSLFVRAVGVLPYIVAMLVVGGVLLAVFVWTGTFPSAVGSGLPGTAADAYAAVESTLDGVNRSFVGLLSRILPAVSSDGIRLGIGLGLVLMAIVVVDRLLSSRAVHRLR